MTSETYLRGEGRSFCATCGQPIWLRSFWLRSFGDGHGDEWFHDRGDDAEVRWQRACGWAEPTEVPQDAHRADLTASEPESGRG